EVRTKLNASAEFIRRQLMGTDNQGSFSSTEEQVSFKTSPSLLQVVGREVNRRDAKLVCHLCETRTELHFYEGDGEPKLDGPLLWTVHYGKCSGVKDEQPIGLRLMWNDGRETENLVLNPSTRKLIPLGS
ncbi:MAG: hypothetical protein JWN02_2073, partial [Acidobacteria bacterium]|nr:hypothetical protein [Acidobacteriota bacterium]